jgi:hypothetical protein
MYMCNQTTVPCFNFKFIACPKQRTALTKNEIHCVIWAAHWPLEDTHVSNCIYLCNANTHLKETYDKIV